MGQQPSLMIDRAFFEPAALEHDLGRRLHTQLTKLLPEVRVLPPRGRVPVCCPPGDIAGAYRAAKRTLVVAVRRNLTFQRCRPSADWQLPLVTSCPGLCAYCYLQTTLGPHPYIRVYVNVDEILAKAAEYAATAATAASGDGRATVFEAAATGDPIAVEPLTGALTRAVEFFGRDGRTLLRVVTKFGSVEPLLAAEHRGRTRVRFSINTPSVVRRWEAGTATIAARLAAAAAVARAGYPIGLMIAPVLAYPGWREEYAELAESVAATVAAGDVARGADGKGLTFEVVTHRFTARARDLILSRHAGAGLPMSEEGRRYRIGQFGYGKWVYDTGQMNEVKEFMADLICRHFPGAALEYVV